MPRVLVIADDLTGAAEISGIATRFGLTAALLRRPAPPPTSVDCVVYDTNSRQLPEAVAGNETRVAAVFASAGTFDWVFKKTDSALRGAPAVEMNWTASVFRRRSTLFLPHNPSRGRVIRGGRYAINGVPLHQTEFANDPDHPAATDDALTLLRSPASARCLGLTDTPGDGVNLCEAATADEIDAWAARFEPTTMLAAGGADFFKALLRRSVPPRRATAAATVRRPMLYVSGTTSPAAAVRRQEMAGADTLVDMPQAVFDGGVANGSAMDAWIASCVRILRRAGAAMLAVGRPIAAHRGKGLLLQNALAAAAARVIVDVRPGTVACEGGATAAAVCEAMDWRAFDVDAELAPGIVMLRSTPAAPRLIVKPGSYAWPAM